MNFFDEVLFLILQKQLIMFNIGEWIVKMVQKPFPFLIPFRAAKTNGVRLQCFPLDEQNILIWFFKTAL